MRVSFAGRDDTDVFFAIWILLNINVDHQQHSFLDEPQRCSPSTTRSFRSSRFGSANTREAASKPTRASFGLKGSSLHSIRSAFVIHIVLHGHIQVRHQDPSSKTDLECRNELFCGPRATGVLFPTRVAVHLCLGSWHDREEYGERYIVSPAKVGRSFPSGRFAGTNRSESACRSCSP